MKLMWKMCVLWGKKDQLSLKWMTVVPRSERKITEEGKVVEDFFCGHENWTRSLLPFELHLRTSRKGFYKSSIWDNYWVNLLFFFVALRFELRCFYHLSHSEPLHQPFSVMSFFRTGCHELFAWAGFEHWSSWSLPPEKLGLQAWASVSGSIACFLR
jgi:hypothetical protein